MDELERFLTDRGLSTDVFATLIEQKVSLLLMHNQCLVKYISKVCKYKIKVQKVFKIQIQNTFQKMYLKYIIHICILFLKIQNT